jgi:hypothetical protein
MGCERTPADRALEPSHGPGAPGRRVSVTHLSHNRHTCAVRAQRRARRCQVMQTTWKATRGRHAACDTCAMDARNLAGSDAPDSPAWREIAGLIDRRIELAGGVDRLDLNQREATQARDAASLAVIDLERRALGGEQVSSAQRKSAESELARARAHAAEPWAERRAGAQRAVADIDRSIGRFVIEHFDDLADGLRAQGKEAAQATDDAANALLAAYAKREEIANRMNALGSMVRPTRPGDVTYSRAETLARAASALLDGGGEHAPDMRDPRQPRGVQPATDEADEAVVA